MASRLVALKTLSLLVLAEALPQTIVAKRKAFSFVESGASLSRSRARAPLDAAWFGEFDQGESTYTPEERPQRDVRLLNKPVAHGWKGGGSIPLTPASRVFEKPAWFHESESAGAQAAWQTHYPAVDGSIAGNRNVENGRWTATPEGWVQDYRTAQDSGVRNAEFFDSAVLSYDGFGRQNKPDQGLPRSFQDWQTTPWQERSVNTTLACAARGCSANGSLLAFNASSAEEATNCRLSVSVHPTDLDNTFGDESVEHWKVNGARVFGKCDPRAMQCDAQAQRPLYPCINDLDVDHLLAGGGTLNIEGKIGEGVDETQCAYNGNLLSAVATVTCLVRPLSAGAPLVEQAPVDPWAVLKESLDKTTMNQVQIGELIGYLMQLGVSPDEAPKLASSVDTRPAGLNMLSLLTSGDVYAEGQLPADLARLRLITYGLTASGTFACGVKGCTAFTAMTVDPTVTDLGGSCFMNVSVAQTDFDASSETIEFFTLGATNLSTAVSPGLNPCNSRAQGTTISDSELTYSLISDRNVTSEVRSSGASGQLNFRAKISSDVDECALDGNLLQGNISVSCRMPNPPTF